MNRGLERRRFLQMASALGLGAELAPWASLKSITPLRASEARVSPEMVRFRPEIEPVVRLIEETPRETAHRGRHQRAQVRAFLPQSARRALPGRDPQHQAQTGRIQVPRRDGNQLGASSGSIVRGNGAPASSPLGTRQLQGISGPRRQGRGLGPPARQRVALAQTSSGASRVRPRDGIMGSRSIGRSDRCSLP